MTLGEIIECLERADPKRIVPVGFHKPHSYRGHYECLAFEPRESTSVATMLDSARSAIGKMYQGYKGGDYWMDLDTEVYLAEWGETGEEIGPTLMFYMTGVR